MGAVARRSALPAEFSVGVEYRIKDPRGSDRGELASRDREGSLYWRP